jgi:hypothetical protein
MVDQPLILQAPERDGSVTSDDPIRDYARLRAQEIELGPIPPGERKKKLFQNP